MIGHIEGTVLAKHDGSLIISVGGLGYKVAAPKGFTLTLSIGASVALWTHLAVREDALDLYGFPTEDELRIFNLLHSVSGIGPKSALAIVDIASVETLRSAISEGNAGYLTKVSGIGKKTADKIILELHDKIGLPEAGGTLKGDEEALEAMRALGYSPQEAREALKKVPRTITNANDRLREALKLMGQ